MRSGTSPASGCSSTAAARLDTPVTSPAAAPACALSTSRPRRPRTPAPAREAKLLERCSVGVMPAETLDYAVRIVRSGGRVCDHPPSGSEAALRELHRVLKPGGTAYFAEPLATNPLIQAYRRVTPQFRTPDEQPLELAKLPALLSDFQSLRAPRVLPDRARCRRPHLPARRHPDLPALKRPAAPRRPGPPATVSGPRHWAWYTVLKITR